MTMLLHSEVGRSGVERQSPLLAMPLSPEEVGHRIVMARDEMRPKRWSRLDLAIALGVSPSSIYRWETGRLPSVNELIRVAEVLGKPVDYLTEPPERQVGMVDLERRLEALEAAVAESISLTREGLTLLREAQPQADGEPGARRSSGAR
jgi:transcriptional regulator with XRE-family HTH domain